MMRDRNCAPSGASRGAWALVGLATAAVLGACDAPPPSPPPGPFGVGSASESDGTTGGSDSDPVNLPPNAESSGTTLPMFTAGGSASDSDDTDDVHDTDAGSDDGTDDTSAADVSTGAEEPPMLPCDDGFTISPEQPGTASFFVEATHEDPLTYVDLAVVGPNTANASYVAVVGENPWRWRFQVSGHIPGIYTVEFGNAPSEGGPVTVHSTCQIHVVAAR